MTFFWTFLIGMMAVSALIWGLCALFGLVDRRVEQWPGLWASGLSLCALIPLAGWTLSLWPESGAGQAFEALSLHAQLRPFGLASHATVDTVALSRWRPVELALASLMSLYLAGVLFHLARLAHGRFCVRRIVLNAECADIAWQEDVLVSPDIQSPFAWTPFGSLLYSRIVIPEAYRDTIGEAQLLDILIHERAHIARRDDECGLVLRVILCLCWLSPFAHRLFTQWSQSTELRCDMAVTAGRDSAMRKAYADTLVQAIRIMADRVRQYPAAAFSTSHIRNEQMRISYIMNGTMPSFKRRRDRVGLGFAAALLATLGALTVSGTASADPVGVKTEARTVVSDIVSGRLTARYGPVADPDKIGQMRHHKGIDIAAPIGAPIFAPMDGVILEATELYAGKPAYGTVVVLQGDSGMMAMFSHLDAFMVQEGQRVAKGTQIATVGESGQATGSHVHIETYQDGKRMDPLSVLPIQLD